MTNSLLYTIKRVQQLCNLKMYSQEELTKTVRSKMWSQLSWLNRTWRQGLHRLSVGQDNLSSWSIPPTMKLCGALPSINIVLALSVRGCVACNEFLSSPTTSTLFSYDLAIILLKYHTSCHRPFRFYLKFSQIPFCIFPNNIKVIIPKFTPKQNWSILAYVEMHSRCSKFKSY